MYESFRSRSNIWSYKWIGKQWAEINCCCWSIDWARKRKEWEGLEVDRGEEKDWKSGVDAKIIELKESYRRSDLVAWKIRKVKSYFSIYLSVYYIF